MKVDNTITCNVNLDRKQTNNGQIYECSDETVSLAKQTLKDGVPRTTTKFPFIIILPGNPWVEGSKDHDKCEDVHILLPLKFKEYSFPKGALK